MSRGEENPLATVCSAIAGGEPLAPGVGDASGLAGEAQAVGSADAEPPLGVGLAETVDDGRLDVAAEVAATDEAAGVVVSAGAGEGG